MLGLEELIFLSLPKRYKLTHKTLFFVVSYIVCVTVFPGEGEMATIDVILFEKGSPLSERISNFKYLLVYSVPHRARTVIAQTPAIKNKLFLLL